MVAEHAAVFRELLDHPCQFRHFQHDLTGLIVLPNKRLANIARGILDSPDKTNISRVLAEAPWREDAVNRRRIRDMRQETTPQRQRRRESIVVLEDTLCEHVSSLCDHVDRHYTPGDGTSPLAHNPVTSFSVSGPVRFPLGLRRSRRYEALTPWDAAVVRHVPALKIPTETKARNRLHTQVDPVWLQDPAFRARHEQCRTNIALAMELGEEASRHNVPAGVVVFDAWYLAEDVVQVLARRRQDWISLRKKNRLLETASVPLREATGWPLPRPGPHMAVDERVPLIPAHASRPVTVREQTSGCVTLAVRIPGVDKVRLVVSFEHESLTGRSGVLVTHRVDGSAAKIISLSWQRGPTEPFDQDSTGPLGFKAYRLRSADAMGKHWCLPFVASALLHLTCLPAVPERTRGLIHTMGDAGRQQGRALIQQLLGFVHAQWSHGVKVARVCAR